MNQEARRFLKHWVIACITFFLLIGALNVLVDPYGMFDAPLVSGFNTRKAGGLFTQLETKPYEAFQAQPKTVVLGASAVFVGLDTESLAWPASYRPVHKFGPPTASPYLSYRYLQHVLSRGRPRLILVGLEFPLFLDWEEGELPRPIDFESRLAVTPDNSLNQQRSRQHSRDLLRASFTLDALSASASTLSASLGDRILDPIAQNTAEQGTAYAVMNLAELQYASIFFDRKPMDPTAAAYLRRIVDLCESQGIRVILFVNPMRADTLELWELMGYWPAYENWKRELVALTMQYRDSNGRSRIPLLDFTSYDEYSAEEVRPNGPSIHWFFDPIHYTPALGELMIKEMLGVGEAHFGNLLNPENIESHLVAIREQRRRYRDMRPMDVKRVHALYQALAANSKQLQ